VVAAGIAALAAGQEDEQATAAALVGSCDDVGLVSFSTVNLSSASSQSCQLTHIHGV